MAKRKIEQVDYKTARGTLHSTKVYRDPEWNEWVVYHYINGVKQDEGYHTSDKADALDTAVYIIERIKGQFA